MIVPRVFLQLLKKNFNVTRLEKMSSLIKNDSLTEMLETRPAVKDPPQGCLFTPFRNTNDIVEHHHLDTEMDIFYKVLHEEIAPECGELIGPNELYKARIQEAILYNVPAFADCWNVGVELAYKLIVPANCQTEENLKLMRILRICMEMIFAMSTILDDIADGSPVRKGKPAWHTFCSGGPTAAMYDGIVLGNLPHCLLMKYFSNKPGYEIMLEELNLANTKMIVGETIDVLGHKSDEFDLNYHRDIISWKAGYFAQLQIVLGLVHAGILDKLIIQQAQKVFAVFGELLQTWDDFNDYYSSSRKTGKPPCDFINGGVTWASITAMNHFNSEQLKLFKDSYGSSNLDNIEVAKKLYDEIDLPKLYIDHMRQIYKTTSRMIIEIPHKKVQDVCFSYLNWLIGGVAD